MSYEREWNPGRPVIPAHDRAGHVGRALQLAAEAPDVHVLHDLRVGDGDRDRYVRHLATCYSSGHMNDEEYRARLHATLKAETREQLNSLVKDLPNLPLPQPATRWLRIHPMVRLAILLTGIIWSLVIATVPTTVVNAAHTVPTWVNAPVSAVTICVGLGALLWLIIAWVRDPDIGNGA
jgi:hypothetical protein